VRLHDLAIEIAGEKRGDRSVVWRAIANVENALSHKNTSEQ
jgi:hypothetical protein